MQLSETQIKIRDKNQIIYVKAQVDTYLFITVHALTLQLIQTNYYFKLYVHTLKKSEGDPIRLQIRISISLADKLRVLCLQLFPFRFTLHKWGKIDG